MALQLPCEKTLTRTGYAQGSITHRIPTGRLQVPVQGVPRTGMIQGFHRYQSAHLWSVGADVFDSSNVDPVRLRNAHAAWIIRINSCSGMALKIVQRSDAPNDAWRNLEFHYRAKATREILRISHEINGKTMEPGSDPFKFMMELDRLAADLHRLGEKSVTELRKCVIIVSSLSADFEMECRILENNPTGLNRVEIERVVGNQYNRLLRQQRRTRRHCRHRRAPSRQIAGRGRIEGSTTSSMETASIAGRKVAVLDTAAVRRKE